MLNIRFWENGLFQDTNDLVAAKSHFTRCYWARWKPFCPPEDRDLVVYEISPDVTVGDVTKKLDELKLEYYLGQADADVPTRLRIVLTCSPATLDDPRFKTDIRVCLPFLGEGPIHMDRYPPFTRTVACGSGLPFEGLVAALSNANPSPDTVREYFGRLAQPDAPAVISPFENRDNREGTDA